jgi:hypothetical protein
MARKSKRNAAFPLPARYGAAIERFARRELWLDALAPKKKPAWWPGMISLFTPVEAIEETARFAELRDEDERDLHYFIGTNTAGMVYALDRDGRVVVFDEHEASDASCAMGIASSFDALLTAAKTKRSP